MSEDSQSLQKRRTKLTNGSIYFPLCNGCALSAGVVALSHPA